MSLYGDNLAEFRKWSEDKDAQDAPTPAPWRPLRVYIGVVCAYQADVASEVFALERAGCEVVWKGCPDFPTADRNDLDMVVLMVGEAATDRDRLEALCDSRWSEVGESILGIVGDPGHLATLNRCRPYPTLRAALHGLWPPELAVFNPFEEE